MPKKFLLVSQVFYPDQVSTAGLFTSLCEEIAKAGIETEVWCAQPSYNTRQKQKSRINYKGITIRYLASTNYSKDKKLGRSLNYITFSISLIFKLLFTKDKTPIFTSTNPPFLGIIIAIVTTLKRRKFNYIIQDVFPEGLIRLKLLKENLFIVRFWKTLNRFTLKKALQIIVIGRDMLQWVEQTNTKALAKTKYIPIWQDQGLIAPKSFDSNPFVSEHELDNKFIVQYSGNMGLWNDMRTFGLVANKLANEQINFVFIGDGVRKAELTDAITSESREHIHFLPFQPKENIGDSITACHIALVSLNTGLEGMAVPSKIMGIMAAGIPVVACVPELSEIAQIVKENECGLIVPPGDEQACANAILKLYAHTSNRKRFGENGRKAFLNMYSTQVIAKEYINLIS